MKASPGDRLQLAAAGPFGGSDAVTIMLAGDVMTGRGIDHVLPYPGDPKLHERVVRSAADYVAMAEQANGPIPRPVDFRYVWGDALAEIERRRPDIRLINLETAVTERGQLAHKEVNYRMTPANFPVITALGVSCCALANNHALDWGHQGLLDTLDTIDQGGVKRAGAGRTLDEAAAPAVLPLPGGRRVLVFAMGSPTSGILDGWEAGDGPGLNVLPDFSELSVLRVAGQVHAAKRPGDLAIVSIHWGGNWGYPIPAERIAFAHGLVDVAGIDIVHGHSTHHAKAVEIYRGRPILYGCGDFLNDYEGIRRGEKYRGDLALMYLLTFRGATPALVEAAAVPFQIRNFRLNRASSADAAWLRDMLDREGQRLQTRAQWGPDGTLNLVAG